MPQIIENRCSNTCLTTHVYSSINHSGSGVSINEWMDKQIVECTSNGVLFSHEKKWSTWYMLQLIWTLKHYVWKKPVTRCYPLYDSIWHSWPLNNTSLNCVHAHLSVGHLFNIKKKFIYFERERPCMSEQVGEGQRERERESQAGSVLSVQSLTWGLIPQTMRSRPELKSRVRCLTNWATQALQIFFK